jgi:tetratricopeptide (TPR) repeat protein
MRQDLVERASELIRRQRFADGLALLRQAIEQDPSQWSAWYMAGQCCRFLGDIDGAIEYLARAAVLGADQAPVFLALGIALQLQARLDDSVEALRRAIEIDPNYDLAYNSLALTQRKMGALDKALHNYDAGAKAIARRIVNAMQNSTATSILKHRDTTGTLWVEHATYGAIYLVARAEGVHGIAWPTGEQADNEERTETHAGLYWIDAPNDQMGTVRLFLPNYFNTFRESLRRDNSYANLTGNRGTVLELLGRHSEARQHIAEANEFFV